MDISFVTVLKLLVLICLSLLISAAGDDLGKCADSLCSVLIGQGVATLDYASIEPDKLSMKSGDNVEIFVKDYGKKKELIGIKLKGKMGFVPKALVKETSESVKKPNLVPASVKFGDSQIIPNIVTGDVSSQPFHQDALNSVPNTVINTQASIQKYQTNQEGFVESVGSLGSSENLQAYTSQNEQPLSSGGYVDPLFGSTTQQQASLDPTHIPQVSGYSTDTHQEFRDLSNVQFPQHQGELNSPLQPDNIQQQPGSSFIGNFQQQPGSSFSSNFQQQPGLSVSNNFQQQPGSSFSGNFLQQPGSGFSDNFQQQTGSEMVNIAQQPAVSSLSSQYPSLPNAQAHHLYSTHMQPAIHSQFNLHQQQFNQFDARSPQDQQHLDSLLASSQHYTQLSADSFSLGSVNGEVNSFSTSAQISSAYPNVAPEVNQGDHSISKQLQEKEQFNYQPSSHYEVQNEKNKYQDTVDLLRHQGYDYEDFSHEQDYSSYAFPENHKHGYDGYNQGHLPEIPVSHHYTQPSQGMFHPNEVNPSLGLAADNTPGTFQDPSQKNDFDNFIDATSLKPSFHATSTHLNVDQSHTNADTEHRTNTDEQPQKPAIFESSKEMDKNNGEAFDEGEVNIESIESDVEEMHGNQENVSMVESNLTIEMDSLSSQDEVTNTEGSGQSVNSILSLETEISNVHESSTQNNTSESDTNINTYETSTQAQATTFSHTNDSIEVNVTESELDSTNDANLNNNEVRVNDVTTQNVNSEVSSEMQSSKMEEPESQVTAKFDDNHIKVSDASLAQDVAIPKYPIHADGSVIEDHVGKLLEEPNGVNEIEQVTQMPKENEMNESLSVITESKSVLSKESVLELNNINAQKDISLKEEINVAPNITEEKHVIAQDFPFNDSMDISTWTSVNINDSGLDKEQQAEDPTMKISEMSEVDKSSYLNPYQIRNLKEDQEGSENVESLDELSENITYPEEDEYSMIDNSLEAIRSFIETFLPWIPEPLYSTIMDLEKKGISPRVPVFTALIALPCILLIIAVVLIKEKSKEKKLTILLAIREKDVFTLTAERVALEEKLEKTTAEFESSKNMLNDERKTFDSMKTEVGTLKQQIDKAKLELENNADEINTLKEREKEFMELIKDHERIHLDLMEEKSEVDKKVAEQEDFINKLSDQVDEKENEVTLLQAEIEKYKLSNEDYEEKLNQLQTNCNQLLKEAEVWNMRVNELNSKLNEESSAKKELENALELKESEVKSLTHLVQTLKSFEDIDSGNEDEQKSSEEKLKCLMDSSKVLIELQKKEEENNILTEKLSEAKNKILEIEVEVLDSKSEVDKLKVNYNQALQDKTEATTKLEVLTAYFKDKELQLQKQLGAQEAFREKREKDADSAERQVVLIEKENASYKYQVASMKQEMEETERNLKTQIATQEKKAHDNWIAARAAERKLEDMKQEVTQLRQRLTLLEREQENWVNSSRDEIIRPIPKRISGMNDDPSHAPDMNNSMDPRHMFPPPMMLPSDRPLPPLPPMPPFLPPLEPPPFRPPPWHLTSEPGSDFRMTPPDFMRRELTPPRGRHSAVIDADMGPLQSSPLGGDMRESRNSTPPHNLPSFHDIPPPPPRPFFPPPPGHHPRYQQPPIFRREFPSGHKRIENQNDTSTGRGSQPTPSSEEHYPHNSRV